MGAPGPTGPSLGPSDPPKLQNVPKSGRCLARGAPVPDAWRHLETENQENQGALGPDICSGPEGARGVLRVWRSSSPCSSEDIFRNLQSHCTCLVDLVWFVGLGPTRFRIRAALLFSTFSRIDPQHFSETSAIYHLLRNLGSSIFISLSVTTVIRTQTTNYSHLREFITPFNESFLSFSALTGIDIERTSDLARLNSIVTDQAQLVGFLNSFGLYTAACLIVIPLIWLIKPTTETN